MILNKKMRFLCLSAATSAMLIGAGVDVFAEDVKTMSVKEEVKTDALKEDAKAMSLKDAMAVGISTNPEYGVVAASRRATDEELNQGKGKFLPSVDVNGNYGIEHSDDPGTRARSTDGDETLWRKEAGVTLTQMLFDGWGTHYEVERQKARVVSSATRVRETAELLGLSIVESYLEVLRQRQLLMIARQNVEDHVSIMGQINDGVKAGRSTQADGEQVKSRLAAARATESNTRQALRNAEAQYIKQVGDAPGELQLPEVPHDSLEEDVDAEVLKVLSNSPTLEIYASDIEVAYAEAQATKASMYPQVDLQMNARTGHDLGGVHGRDTSETAMVVMNWNLYRGGADVARSREFVHRHQQTKEERTQAARNVESDVRQTWASMVSAGERAVQFSAQADANSEVVKAYKDQFSLDRRTLLDVLDSQNELFVSRSNTINAEFLEMFAVYRLMALEGKLLPYMGLEYPRESALNDDETWKYEERQKAR